MSLYGLSQIPGLRKGLLYAWPISGQVCQKLQRKPLSVCTKQGAVRGYPEWSCALSKWEWAQLRIWTEISSQSQRQSWGFSSSLSLLQSWEECTSVCTDIWVADKIHFRFLQPSWGTDTLTHLLRFSNWLLAEYRQHKSFAFHSPRTRTFCCSNYPKWPHFNLMPQLQELLSGTFQKCLSQTVLPLERCYSLTILLCQTMLSCLSPHNHYLVTISMRSKPFSETSKTKAWQMSHFLVCMFKVPTVKNLQVVGLWEQSRVDYKKPECQSQLPFLQQEDRFAAHTGVSHWSVKFQFLTA